MLALCVAPVVASASGISIAWNDCYGAGGNTNRSFACNANAGSNVLVTSFDPPDLMPQVIGGSAVIELRGAAQTLPPWWQLSAGGCRAGALHVAFNPPGSQNCADPWSGAATGAFAYQLGVDGQPDRARITVSWGIPEALAAPVQPGTEYAAFELILDNASTVGVGACAGCVDPACIGFTALWLYQPAGMGDYLLCTPLSFDLATWQGGAIWGGCPGTDDSPPPFPSGCGATSAVRRTWGLIKAIYR